jgi:hypothetical protein
VRRELGKKFIDELPNHVGGFTVSIAEICHNQIPVYTKGIDRRRKRYNIGR